MDEVVSYLAGLNIRNSSFVKLIGCPLPSHNQSFSSVLHQARVGGIRALSVSMVRGATVLEGAHLAGLSGLCHLDLANNGIKRIKTDFFKDFPHLKVLDLSSNDGIVFEEGSLDNLTKLEELKLSSCGIQTISRDFFAKMSSLKILNLHGNRISELPADVFRNQIFLTNLVLTRNLLISFPSGIFDNMTALTKIDLGYNRFQVFPEKLFFKNKELKFFSVILNGACPSIHPQCKDAITKLKLPENLFVDSSMEEIKIVASPIHEIPSNLLSRVSKLKKLTIKESMIESLPESLFQSNKNLEHIDLSGNLLTNLPDNIFLGLQRLETLEISTNKLQSINRHILHELDSLKTLRLAKNRIRKIDSNALVDNYQLEEIDFSENMITNDDTECFKANILEKLKILNLANNQITSIDQDILILSELQNLNLSNNLIGDIKPIDINFKPLLSNRIPAFDFKQNHGLVVDLSYNRIERFILKNGFNISGPNFKLNLDGNPFICDCTITELKQKLEGRPDKSNLYADMFTLTSNRLSCGTNSFGRNSGKYLQNVRYEDLLCPFPSASMPFDCTEPCSCFLDRFHRETIMNCSNQNLTTFPQTLVLLEGESDTIQLHLENNSLTNILYETIVPFFQNISHLYLSGNKIENIDRKMIPENLKVLSLDNNRIERIDEEDLEYLDSQVKNTGLQLKLGKNPYPCSCDSRGLYHFVQNRKDVILDARNISLKCDERYLELLDSDLLDFCDASLSPVLIVIVIIIVLILLLACILLIFYSCHRETIKIWIYSKSWARIFFTEDLIDKDKPYDAFISYSHIDAEFVEKVLLPGLENPDVGSDPYKCLIHTRDWNIGQMIPDQIIHSVESSRRTIIVLSKAYIEAMWTKLEFRAAHTQAIQDRTKVGYQSSALCCTVAVFSV